MYKGIINIFLIIFFLKNHVATGVIDITDQAYNAMWIVRFFTNPDPGPTMELYMTQVQSSFIKRIFYKNYYLKKHLS